MSNLKKRNKTSYTTRYFNKLRPPMLRPDGSVLTLDVDACFRRYWDVGELNRSWNRATRRECAAEMRQGYEMFFGSPED